MATHALAAQTTERRTIPNQTTIGLTLAAMIVTAWLCLHIYGVYLHRWSAWSVAIVPAVVAVQTWLSVGLFIIAHDAMHGSLAPGRPRLNAGVGSVVLALYAGFRFRKLNTAHHAHHAAPGTAQDPDFFAAAPRAFIPWFVNFFRTYFGWTELVVLTLLVAIAVFVLKAGMANLLVFWAAPALLSALQLFLFGTWLPHRHTDTPFADAHNSRSSGFGELTSLLTCFHFGRHHQHHVQPWLPWWRLKG
ncbi:fatty acid desaturase [Brevundimonas sp.]|uniref:fatty acid desaturase n=1 Tax=Brevundimonas sp. TaxID=1871086 RepID=UPI003BAB731A